MLKSYSLSQDGLVIDETVAEAAIFKESMACTIKKIKMRNEL